jgi:hypothetical protein
MTRSPHAVVIVDYVPPHIEDEFKVIQGALEPATARRWSDPANHEAQNFAPSQGGAACKAGARSLVAQARKYGLGMIFATQLPKGIDNAIVSNCMTHVYGRMSSPATIQATQELMSAKGGAADDIVRLTKGEFYFSTDGFNRPVKVRTPLCLSWHPPNPPTADEVITKAHSKRP